MAASVISCSKRTNIGETMKIYIEADNPSYTHDISWQCRDEFYNKDVNGTVATGVAGGGLTWTIPTKHYEYIPYSQYYWGVLTCRTYNGSTLIGSTQCNYCAVCDKSECAPVLSESIYLDPTWEYNKTHTIELTGSENIFIKNYSRVKATCNPTYRNGAFMLTDMTGETVSNGGFEYTCHYTSSSSSETFYSTAGFILQDKTVIYRVIDSRSFESQITQELQVVDYTKPTCIIEVGRTNNSSNGVTLTIRGKFFNQSFGVGSNSITVKYQYSCKNDGTGVGWTDVTPTISGNNYEFTTTLYNNFDKKKTYEFQALVTDTCATIYSNKAIVRGLPVFDWNGSNFNFNVPVKFTGGLIPTDSTKVPVGDYVVYQGTSNGWTYRQWNSGIAECWKKGSDVFQMSTENSTQYGGIILESGLFGGGSYPTFTGGYGHFKETPNLFISVTSSRTYTGSTSIPLLTAQIRDTVSSTDLPRWTYLFLTTETSLKVIVDISLYAIGRWKS